MLSEGQIDCKHAYSCMGSVAVDIGPRKDAIPYS